MVSKLWGSESTDNVISTVISMGGLEEGTGLGVLAKPRLILALAAPDCFSVIKCSGSGHTFLTI